MSADIGSIAIEPNIDAYGTYARASALADYLEVAAIAGLRITRKALQDLIVDNEWVRRPRRQFMAPVDAEEDPGTWAESVFNIIAERSAQLGDLYPFEERGRSVQRKVNAGEPIDCLYTALLAMTVVHAWNLPTTVDPEPVLEDVVAHVLQQRGLASVNIGATDRGVGFAEALQRGGEALSLRPMRHLTIGSRFAKDAGVDTLAGVVWRDSRPAGHWIFIGQATITKSHHWQAKLNEPQGPRWATLLQEPLHPQAFLAVPHHAEEEHLRDLLVSQQGVVIDRLRLVPWKPANSPEEVALIEAMMAVSVA